MYTLEELEKFITALETSSQKNLVLLDQAIAAMGRGKVGARILDQYGQLADLAVVIRDATKGVDEGLEANRTLRDVRAQVPDAGDNDFLMGE